MKKQKKVWTAEERKAFGEKMKAARAAKGVCRPKPEKVEIPEEVKGLSVSEPETVRVFVKNQIRINGVPYRGMCNVSPSFARDLQYRSDMVDERKRMELVSTDHTKGMLF